jgi:sortase B
LETAAKVARGANRVLDFIVGLAIVLVMLFGGYSLWNSYMLYKGAYTSSDLLKYKPSADNPSNPTLAELMKLNPDVRAWLTVDGTHIDYPVVQGKTNLDYINKDVYGQFSFSGSIFLDCNNASDFSDFYSLLYGHHMEHGAMFGDIADFRQQSYFDTHKTGTLYLPGKTYSISLFACVSADAYDSKIFSPAAVKTTAEKQEMLSYIKSKSLNYRDLGLTANDKIIAMSTCTTATTNGRTVLFGRLVPKK